MPSPMKSVIPQRAIFGYWIRPSELSKKAFVDGDNISRAFSMEKTDTKL